MFTSPYLDDDVTSEVPGDTPGILRALNVLDYFGRPVRSLLHGDPANALKSLASPMGGGVKAYSFTEDLEKAGWGTFPALVAGTLGDIVTDPLTIFGGFTGLSKSAARASRHGGKVLRQGFAKSTPLTKEALETSIQRVAAGQTADVLGHARLPSALGPEASLFGRPKASEVQRLQEVAQPRPGATTISALEDGIREVDVTKAAQNLNTEQFIADVESGRRMLGGMYKYPFSWLHQWITGKPAEVIGTNFGLDTIGRSLGYEAPGEFAGRVLKSVAYGPSGLREMGIEPGVLDKTLAQALGVPFRLSRATFATVPGVGRAAQAVGKFADEKLPTGERSMSLLSGAMQRAHGMRWLTERHLVENAQDLLPAMHAARQAWNESMSALVEGPLKMGSIHEAMDNEAIIREVTEVFSAQQGAIQAAKSADPEMFKDVSSSLDAVRKLISDPASLTNKERAAAVAEHTRMKTFLADRLAAGGSDAAKNLKAGRLAEVFGAKGVTDQAGQTAAERLFDQLTGAAVDYGTVLKQAEDVSAAAVRKYGVKLPELGDVYGHVARSVGAGTARQVAGDLPKGGADPRGQSMRDPIFNGIRIPGARVFGMGAVDASGEARYVHGTAAANWIFKNPELNTPLDMDRRFTAALRDAHPGVVKYAGEPLSSGAYARTRDGKTLMVQDVMPDGDVLVYNFDSRGMGLVKAADVDSVLDFSKTRPEVMDELNLWGRAMVSTPPDMLMAGKRDHRRIAKQLAEDGVEWRMPPGEEQRVAGEVEKHNETVRDLLSKGMDAPQPKNLEQELASARKAWNTERRVEMADYIVRMGSEQSAKFFKEGVFGKQAYIDTIASITTNLRRAAAMSHTMSMLSYAARNANEVEPSEAIRVSDLFHQLDLAPDTAEQAFGQRANAIARGQFNEGMASVIPQPEVSTRLDKALSSVGDQGRLTDHLFVPNKSADLVRSIVHVYQDPEKVLHPIAELMETTNALFKKFQYSIWTGSQLRNRISGEIANVATLPTGMAGIGKYITRAKDWARYMLNPQEQSYLTKNGQDVLRLAVDAGIADGSQIAEVFGREVMSDAAAGGLPVPFRTLSAEQARRPVAPLLEAFRQYAPSAIRSETFRREFRHGLQEVMAGNPGPVRRAAGTAKVALRAKELSGFNLAARAELSNRIPVFAHLLDEGWSVSEAAKHVKATQFDYSDLSTADRYLRSFIPFWTWTRKNLPAQVLNLLRGGGENGAKLLVRLSGGSQRLLQDEQTAVPEYIREGSFIPGNTDPRTRRAWALTLKGLSPHEDLHWMGSSGEQPSIPGFSRRNIEKLGGMLNPAIMGLLQWHSGREFYSGKPLRDLKSPLGLPPEAGQLVQAFAGRPLGMLRDIVESGTEVTRGEFADAAKMIARLGVRSTIGGVRAASYFPEEEAVRQQRSLLERYLERQPGVGVITRPFVKKQEGVAPNLRLEGISREIDRLTEMQRKLRLQRAAMGF